MITAKVRPGIVCRHHSGRVYTVLAIANNVSNPRDGFPVTVQYLGANGQYWSRPLSEFAEKFTILFDGTNLAAGEGE
jgi:hypothetical protein